MFLLSWWQPNSFSSCILVLITSIGLVTAKNQKNGAFTKYLSQGAQVLLCMYPYIHLPQLYSDILYLNMIGFKAQSGRQRSNSTIQRMKHFKNQNNNYY